TTRMLLLLFMAALALIGGLFNLRDRVIQKEVPADGVIWVDQPRLGVVAEYVDPKGPAYGAGVRAGDALFGICAGMCKPETDQFDEITEARYVQLYLDHVKEQIKDGYRLSYWITRENYPIREGVAYLERL